MPASRHKRYCTAAFDMAPEVSSGQTSLQQWWNERARYLKVASQTQCEACNNSQVIMELRAGYLAVLYQLRKSPLSGLCKEPSVACSAETPPPPALSPQHRGPGPVPKN